MPTLAMYQVDAFADRVFAGNPAAILILDYCCRMVCCRALPRRTTWPRRPSLVRTAQAGTCGGSRPCTRLIFCGHATLATALATAHVLSTKYGAQSDLVFATHVGELRVSGSQDGYTLDLSRFPPDPVEDVPPVLAEIFPVEALAVFRNFEILFVELSAEPAVRDFVPDLLTISTLHPLGLVVTGKGDTYDFVSRYFVPGAGIPEDPILGSIHANLVPYWANKLGKQSMSAFQCSRRGGHLICELAGGRVLLTGNAVTFMKSDIFMPD